jgi:hypothetical protein
VSALVVNSRGHAEMRFLDFFTESAIRTRNMLMPVPLFEPLATVRFFRLAGGGTNALTRRRCCRSPTRGQLLLGS